MHSTLNQHVIWKNIKWIRAWVLQQRDGPQMTGHVKTLWCRVAPTNKVPTNTVHAICAHYENHGWRVILRIIYPTIVTNYHKLLGWLHSYLNIWGPWCSWRRRLLIMSIINTQHATKENCKNIRKLLFFIIYYLLYEKEIWPVCLDRHIWIPRGEHSGPRTATALTVLLHRHRPQARQTGGLVQ